MEEEKVKLNNIQLVNQIEAVNYIQNKLNTYVDCDELRDYIWEKVDNKKFISWPASGSRNHSYKTGLLTHTAEVLYYGVNAPLFKEMTHREQGNFVAAAVAHDWYKINDYYYDEESGLFCKYSGNTSKVHVEGIVNDFSNWYFKERIFNVMDISDVYEIRHALAAQHGRLDWNTLEEPNCAVAYLLHHADMWSYLYGMTKDTIVPSPFGLTPEQFTRENVRNNEEDVAF